MMTREKLVSISRDRLPAGVRDDEPNETLVARLSAEGFLSIAAEALRSGLVAPVKSLHDRIAARAFEISQSPSSGTPDENWNRAAAELSASK